MSSKHPLQRLMTHTTGAIYVEFLMVFFPIFLIFLTLIQLSLMDVAQMVLEHAAFRGARAASVVLDDDPKHYDGSARLCLAGEGASEDESFFTQFSDFLRTNTPSGSSDSEDDSFWSHASTIGEQWVSGESPDELQGFASAYRTGNPRLQAIRTAVYTPLLTVAPEPAQFLHPQTIERAIGTSPLTRILGGLLYNLGAVAVTFPVEPGSDEFKIAFEADDSVTVRTTYLYYCGVPLVSALMCNGLLELLTGVPIATLLHTAKQVQEGNFSVQDLQRWNDELQKDYTRLRGSKKGISELAAAESPILQVLASITNAKFKVLRAEATLPIHSAAYRYKDEESAPCESPEASGGGT